jgi:hypothetical protein
LEADGIAVAKVDATIEISLASRMSIGGYPSLLLYSNAEGSTKMYKYEGARSADNLAEFARSGYKQATSTWYPSRMLYLPVDGLIKAITSLEKAMTECTAQGAGACVAIVCGCLVGLVVGAVILYTCIFESSSSVSVGQPPEPPKTSRSAASQKSAAAAARKID